MLELLQLHGMEVVLCACVLLDSEWLIAWHLCYGKLRTG
jgi:hypothetical protein